MADENAVLMYLNGSRSFSNILNSPNNILAITSNLFEKCYYTSIDTNCVEEISDFAFANMQSELEKFVIGDSVKTIGKNILNNTHVKKLKVPFIGNTINDFNQHINYLFDVNNKINYNLKSYIDKKDNYNLSKFEKKNEIDYLEKIVVTLQTYYYGTFKNCLFAKEILVSKDTKHIGSDTFANCVKLVHFYAPKSVNIIENFAFIGCNHQLILHIFDIKQEWGKHYSDVKNIPMVGKIFSIGFAKNKKAKVEIGPWEELSYEL